MSTHPDTAPHLLSRLAIRMRDQGRSDLSESDGKRVLSEFGIAVPRSVTIRDLGDAERAFTTLTPPTPRVTALGATHGSTLAAASTGRPVACRGLEGPSSGRTR